MDLSQKDAVAEIIENEVKRVNRALPEGARIRKFVSLHKEFDADDDELTRTRKIRRAFVENRYKDIIGSMYEGKDMLHMDTNITYEDGRVVKIKADIRLQDVKEGGRN